LIHTVRVHVQYKRYFYINSRSVLRVRQLIMSNVYILLHLQHYGWFRVTKVSVLPSIPLTTPGLILIKYDIVDQYKNKHNINDPFETSCAYYMHVSFDSANFVLCKSEFCHTVISQTKCFLLKENVDVFSTKNVVYATSWPDVWYLLVMRRYGDNYITPPTSFQPSHWLKWRHVTAQYFTILGQLKNIWG